MKILGIDTETTGLNQSEGHRIIEYASVRVGYDGHSFTRLGETVLRVNPERLIDPKAEAVHRISIGELAREPVWKTVAPQIAADLQDADLIVAHNMEFDGPFLAAELMRVGLMPPKAQAFCTMLNGLWATPWGKRPKLSELAWALGYEYDTSKAHGALYDVELMLTCLQAGIQRGHYKLPVT